MTTGRYSAVGAAVGIAAGVLMVTARAPGIDLDGLEDRCLQHRGCAFHERLASCSGCNCVLLLRLFGELSLQQQSPAARRGGVEQ